LEWIDDVLQLKIAAWGERVEGLADDVLGVFEAGKECAAMDIFKFLSEIPVVFCVVDFKAAVRRDAVPELADALGKEGESTKVVGLD
jgi:hypothetical protein